MVLTRERLGAHANRLLKPSAHEHASRFESAHIVLAKLALANVSLLVRQASALANGCREDLHASVDSGAWAPGEELRNPQLHLRHRHPEEALVPRVLEPRLKHGHDERPRRIARKAARVQAHIREAAARWVDAIIASSEGVEQHRLDHRRRLLVALLISTGASLLTFALRSLGEQRVEAQPAGRWRPARSLLCAKRARWSAMRVLARSCAHDVFVLTARHVANVVGHGCLFARIGRVRSHSRGMHPEVPSVEGDDSEEHLPNAWLAREQSASVLAEPRHVRRGLEGGRCALEGCDRVAEGGVLARYWAPQAVVGNERVGKGAQ